MSVASQPANQQKSETRFSRERGNPAIFETGPLSERKVGCSIQGKRGEEEGEERGNEEGRGAEKGCKL